MQLKPMIWMELSIMMAQRFTANKERRFAQNLRIISLRKLSVHPFKKQET